MNMNTYYCDYFPVTHLTATCCRSSGLGKLVGLRSTHFSSFNKLKKKKKSVGKKQASLSLVQKLDASDQAQGPNQFV